LRHLGAGFSGFLFPEYPFRSSRIVRPAPKWRFLLATMTVTDYYQALAELLTKISDFPDKLVDFKRETGLIITAEKNRRVSSATGIKNGCMMEETDLNKLAAITKFDAISRKKDIIAGRFSHSERIVRPFVCDACWNKYRVDEIRLEKETAKREYEQEKRQAQAAANLLQREQLVKYVNTKGKEGKGSCKAAYWEYSNQIRQYPDRFEHLKTMPYSEFLATTYWWVIRNYVLIQSGFECKLCRKKNTLQVHHRHYENRGKEWRHWKEDLVVLCARCHAKHHDKIQPPSETTFHNDPPF